MEELISNAFYSGLFIGIGLAFLFLEIFIPSGGILGILFFACAAFGVYGFFYQGRPYVAVSTVVGVLVFGFYAIRYGLQRTTLTASMDSEAYTSVDEDIADLVGRDGTTETELRPAGVALIGGEKIDVVSPGYFIGRGVKVRVIDNTGNRVVVRETQEDPHAAPG